MRAQDAKVNELASRQLGLITRAQLLRLGLGGKAIGHRLTTGRLVARHRGVYTLGPGPLTDLARWTAAVWACGEGTALSHPSAAAHARMADEEDPGVVHVSTTRHLRGSRGRDVRIVVHQVRHLDPVDVAWNGHIRVTRVPRIYVDEADRLSYAALRALVDQQRRIDPVAIRAAQARSPNRRGAANLTRLLERDEPHSRSVLERRYLALCAAHGIRRPDGLNVRRAGYDVDAVYEAERLVVELDGRAYHERRAQMAADRRRDADLQIAGFRVLRLVWDQFGPGDEVVTARLVRALLGAR
jgi:very-short-patch-repair endonuclease